MKNDRTDELREASGKVVYSDPLTSFLYQLIRDELPAGKVEKIVRDVLSEGDKEVLFTNGWLAQYANNLAEMIKNAHTEKLKETLTKVFDAEEADKINAEKIAKAMDKLRSKETLEEFTPEELDELEKRVVVACKNADVDPNVNPTEAWTSFDEAAEMIEQLKAEGQISKEDAERLDNELKEVETEISGIVEDIKNDEEVIELTDEVIEEIKPAACGNNWFRATDQDEEEESKKPCCGKCKHDVVVDAVDANTVDQAKAQDKWQETQKYLEDLDKELDTLAPKQPIETKIVITEPRTIGPAEKEDVVKMINGMIDILQKEVKKEE
jgi:hypothetical protein